MDKFGRGPKQRLSFFLVNRDQTDEWLKKELGTSQNSINRWKRENPLIQKKPEPEVILDVPPTNIPDDLLQDIRKIKAVMDQFGDKVRLSEVQSYLKEMNQLKPSREEDIKDSLRTLNAEELTAIILPSNQPWLPLPALDTTFDQSKLKTLIEESDL